MKQQENNTIGRPGLPCPACGTFIPISLAELLASHRLICPACGLHLEMDSSSSEKAMKALTALDAIQKQRDKAKQCNP